MGLMSFATVGVKSNWDFCDPCAIDVRLDDHLGGKFHPGATQIQTLVELFRKTSQATVDVVDLRPEHSPYQDRKHRVAKPSMKKRHCVWHNATTTGGKSTALDQLKPFS